MTLQQTVSVFHLVISLFALWILAFWFLRDYRIDSFRERLFELRQELFDCAAKGVVPFDHPAYADLRNIMNGMIRFAHKTTFLRLLLAVTADSIFPVPSIKKPYQDWERAVKQLSSIEAQKKLFMIHARMAEIVVWHMLTGSLILQLCLIIYVMWALINGAAKRLFEAFVKRLPGLELLEGYAALCS